jgi:hypothetical protein
LVKTNQPLVLFRIVVSAALVVIGIALIMETLARPGIGGTRAHLILGAVAVVYGTMRILLTLRRR